IVSNSQEAHSILNLDGIGARAVYAPDRNNWAPRAGAAYRLTPKTVLRGGYGIFFTNSQNFLNNFVINRRQPPFAETQQITSSTSTPQINIANPFISASAPLVIGTQNINPNFLEGYTQQWNLTLQRQLPGGILRDLRGYSRGLSGFDARRRLVISYVYELPFGRGRGALKNLNPALNWFVSGWELSGITQFQDGFPFSVVMSGDVNGDGIP